MSSGPTDLIHFGVFRYSLQQFGLRSSQSNVFVIVVNRSVRQEFNLLENPNNRRKRYSTQLDDLSTY